ncbi:MAG TPA: HAD-IIA family hydrolase [Candidatus Limnocylindria bacterium]|nr:HAD-IIA family hydrolase [Candidatus Limnocylindria bacterium]
MDISLREALSGKRLWLLDMDGTLYLGRDLFPDTPAFLRAIREGGGDYLFLTNNSSKSPEAYVKLLASMGIGSAREDFFTSADAACAYLEANYRGKRIYVLGTASLREQVAQAGFPVTDMATEDVDCLLMGYDTELTYRKLVDASILLTRGVEYLATNPDWVCPTEFGFVPDCGAFAQALEHATGRLPLFLGKPRPDIALLAMKKKGATPAQTVLVGDRLYTDIACANAAGATSILVFSGETTPEHLEKSETKPDFAIPGIGYILEAMR